MISNAAGCGAIWKIFGQMPDATHVWRGAHPGGLSLGTMNDPRKELLG